jgi:hypothetical protein
VIGVVAENLNKLARFGGRQSGKTKNQSEMIAAQWEIGDDARDVLAAAQIAHRGLLIGQGLKKDFRRGGSCPPPEVRHG